MNILIIGGGNMGSAIAKGLSASSIFERLTVCDTNPEKRKALKEALFENFPQRTGDHVIAHGESKIAVVSELSSDIVRDADVILLAVKPQGFPDMMSQLAPLLAINEKFSEKHTGSGNSTTNQRVSGDSKLIISIAAGITIDTIRRGLGNQRIVRVMPNTPALIHEGISGWVADDHVSEKDKTVVRNILHCLGEEVEISFEDQMDIVTAISGCGPAYVFYFLEHLIQSASELGLPLDTAKRLALKTFEGSAKLALQSHDDLDVLRKRVTSPGGTTEAALNYFEHEHFPNIIREAVKKAYERGRELGTC